VAVKKIVKKYDGVIIFAKIVRGNDKFVSGKAQFTFMLLKLSLIKSA